MSHTTYTTPAYVLASSNIGEANRLLTLLSRDLGTLSATAQGVRLEKSKLRFSLQRFSFIEVSLVRGRGGWRVTNAQSFNNIFFNEDAKRQKIVVHITGLLRRLVVGEAPDAELFNLVSRGFSLLSVLSTDNLSSFELVFVSKILTKLGYGTESGILEKFEEKSIEDESLRRLAQDNRALIVREINEALASSGL